MRETAIEAMLRDARKATAEYERLHEELEREARTLEATLVPVAEALGAAVALDKELAEAWRVIERASAPTPTHIPPLLPCECRCHQGRR